VTPSELEEVQEVLRLLFERAEHEGASGRPVTAGVLLMARQTIRMLAARVPQPAETPPAPER